ncbi:MAG: tetratricopeptide repeat protein [Oceanicaulis sp.]|uniref:tetratricopeptide repeat protein n=1 Tax=Glycocaulis sp. TaxID=1969725 RepID=UPI0025C0DAE9|nr:tetratricopeptide repeat protein [Glycocaulis sp.]MCC5981389.1 tetratricopeptide repeat protein [Oceanicaulis sp.]MCH8522742.1 tetratricopeptide repeat protein [Glycocaulis sp.]
MSRLLDLDAELAKGVEQAVERDADTSAAIPGLDLTAATARTKADAKTVAKLRRAMALVDAGKATEGARLALKVLDENPELGVANQAVGMALEHLGRLSKALEFYERALQRDPKNPEIYQSLGLLASKLGLLPTAEKFMRLYLQMNPKAKNGLLNLAAVLRDQAKFDDAIELLRQAIYADQENPDLWNALGTAVMEAGDAAEAATFHAEALRLKPGYGRAHHNLAHVLELQGDVQGALTHFRAALANAESERDSVITSHGLSHTLLSAGELEEGWEMYRWRLDRHYSFATNYLIPAPPWDGADPAELNGQTLVIVGEQGIGDEVLFANTFADAIRAVGKDGEVRIACEKRLIPLFRRSFPKAVVERHFTVEREGRQHRHAPDLFKDGKANLWTPAGNLCRTFRSDASRFPSESGFLKADPARVDAFAKQLAALGPGPKVGVLWKSLKMNAARSKHFAPFEMWKPILKTPGAVFINLQYGEVDEELAEAEARFGVKIHQPQGIDLKDDLDGVAALGKACDLVLGPMNATTNLTASVGGLVWFIRPIAVSWTLLGRDQMLWYPQTRTFAGERYRDWAGGMKKMAQAFGKFIENHARKAA